MPALVSLVLLVFWLAMAWRSYQRGDMLFASVFLLVGIVLTVYRLRSAKTSTSTSTSAGRTDSTRS